jgi:epoxyqueuosine reductase
VRRAGRDGFLRNVCVALGNRGDPATVAPLSRATGDASALVRRHAAWALGRIATEPAIEALRAARERENDAEVVEEIDAALAEAIG